MDFSKSPQEVVLECVTAAAEDSSTTTDLSSSAPKETAASDILTTDVPQSICAPFSAVEYSVSPAETERVKSSPTETVDKPTMPITSSPRNDAHESQPKVSSQMKSSLQGFQTLRAKMLSQLDAANERDEDNDSAVIEEKMIIQRFLESVELGIGEMQASIIDICNTILL